jgi:hypothetical protein
MAEAQSKTTHPKVNVLRLTATSPKHIKADAD